MMLIQKLQYYSKETPDKQAIVYKGKSLTYIELWNELETRANSIALISQRNLLLAHNNESENLLNFLAGMMVGKVGIFTSKHLNKSQLNVLKTQHSGFVLDENHVFASDYSTTDTHSSPPNILDRFLGVLSSGTTATPKLIWKDYQSWFTAFPHQSKVFGISASDRLFVLDALSYSANLNSILHILWLGGTAVMTTLISANTWIEQIENESVSSIFMVPSHYRLLIKNGLENEVVKSVVSAGEKLDIATAQKLIKEFPKAKLTEYYGSAELGHITYHQDAEIVQNQLSVGQPFPQVNIKLENDQIFVDSPYISPDFRNLKTNFDLGYFIDNQLILIGRAGRMFNRRGLNIFAEEIENATKTLPFIIDAKAVGILQSDNSHEIFLAYTCQNGYQQNAHNKQILKYLATHLQAAKIPQRLLEFESLPRTDFGKIDFNALARTFEEEIFA